MTRWTPKLIKDQFAWTNACYKQALIDVFSDHLSQANKELSCEGLRSLLVCKQDNLFMQRSEQVNEAYLRHIRGLDTNKIELIIEAYTKGKQNRSPATIDVLLYELFDRATNPEMRREHE